MPLDLTEEELPCDQVMMIKRLPGGRLVTAILYDSDSEGAVTKMRDLIDTANQLRVPNNG